MKTEGSSPLSKKAATRTPPEKLDFTHLHIAFLNFILTSLLQING
jgi:hypothetical protein